MLKDKLKFTAEMEGLRLMPYICPAGKLTVGYGHNIEDNGISSAVAEAMLSEDLSECDRILRLKFKGIANKDNYIIAICRDMLFNLGYARFSKFKNFIKAIEQKQDNIALSEMADSEWFKQVGRRSKILWLSLYYTADPLSILDEIRERANRTCLSESFVTNENFYKAFIEWYETKASPAYSERPRLKALYKQAVKEFK